MILSMKRVIFSSSRGLQRSSHWTIYIVSLLCLVYIAFKLCPVSLHMDFSITSGSWDIILLVDIFHLIKNGLTMRCRVQRFSFRFLDDLFRIIWGRPWQFRRYLLYLINKAWFFGHIIGPLSRRFIFRCLQYPLLFKFNRIKVLIINMISRDAMILNMIDHRINLSNGRVHYYQYYLFEFNYIVA